jgi:hypothetical protein
LKLENYFIVEFSKKIINLLPLKNSNQHVKNQIAIT